MATTQTPANAAASGNGPDSDVGKYVYARTYAGMAIDKDRDAGDDAAIVWRIFKLAAKRRLRLALAAVTILAAGFFQLLIPQYLGDAVDGAVMLLGSASTSPEEARDALYGTALLLLGALGPARPVHPDPQLLRRNARASSRLSAPDGLLRQAAASELHLS